MQKLTPEQTLAILADLIRTAPGFETSSSSTDEELRWLGKADAILEATGSMNALVTFRSARNSLGTYMFSRTSLLSSLHDAYAKAELFAPAEAQGAFIPAGDTWNGFAALLKLIQGNYNNLLVVDPYINFDFYTSLAPAAPKNSELRLLTTKRSENHSSLIAVANKWNSESNGAKCSLRYAPKGSLHDRLFIFDNGDVWLISQSLKDIAAKSPASVTKAQAEIAEMKAAHYTALWKDAASV